MRSELEEAERSLWRLSNIIDQVNLHPGSIEAFPSLMEIVKEVMPDECYHLAARSFISFVFDEEFGIFNTNVTATHYILSALKNIAPKCRFYFACSSEVFGHVKSFPQNENTPFQPRSAYGITKATSYYLTNNYRENYGIFACNGILYNHESPRRGYEFVTRKITYGASQIKTGLAKDLKLGYLDAVRDWGFAGDYVNAMWLMLQQDKPEDFVVATGEAHTVREVCEIAFSRLDLDYKEYVVLDERFVRPAETIPLIGDSSKARNILGWQPQVSFQELIEMMVDADLNRLTQQGFKIEGSKN
jgi:GDPmannose 4,6-dehydratase